MGQDDFVGWIQERGLHVDMPKEGRSEWSPPAEVPGIIHTVLSIHDGKVVASSAAEGGVDDRVKATFRDAVAEKPRNDSTATVPTAGTKQQLENNYKNASTPEDKARAAIELWRAVGGDKWFDQAFKDNPNAAAEAIRGGFCGSLPTHPSSPSSPLHLFSQFVAGRGYRSCAFK